MCNQRRRLRNQGCFRETHGDDSRNQGLMIIIICVVLFLLQSHSARVYERASLQSHQQKRLFQDETTADDELVDVNLEK